MISLLNSPIDSIVMHHTNEQIFLQSSVVRIGRYSSPNGISPSPRSTVNFKKEHSCRVKFKGRGSYENSCVSGDVYVSVEFLEVMGVVGAPQP